MEAIAALQKGTAASYKPYSIVPVTKANYSALAPFVQVQNLPQAYYQVITLC